MKTQYECKNDECQKTFDVEYHEGTPDSGMSGPWCEAEQGTAAECEPSHCPHCQDEVDMETVEKDFEQDPDYYQQ